MIKRGKHWLRYSICIHPFRKQENRSLQTVHDHWHVLKVFDYPSEIIYRWDWYVKFCTAKLQVRFPRHHISLRVCGYWPDAEPDSETLKKRQISAARAQVTKVQNIIRMRRNELSKELFQDETNDPVMIKARRKLDEKQFKLNQLIVDKS